MESRIEVLDKGFVELIDHMGDDNTVVSSARVSLLGESKGESTDKALINFLLKNEHTTPFEHVSFTFRIKCPMFIARQWMRHRTWSYNEVSRRYTSEDIDFYIPTKFRKQAKSNRQASADESFGVILLENGNLCYVEDFMKDYSNLALQTYNFLLDTGVAREQARMVLPQNLYTMFYASVDLHNLLRFIHLRDSAEAQYEIRVYAQALTELIKPIVPWTYEAWKGLKNVSASA